MEPIPQTQQMLEELKLSVGNSATLDMVTPLFDTLHLNDGDPHYPKRISIQKDHSQLLWEKGEWKSSNFDRLCLSLSRQTLSLTSALDHHHKPVDDIPSIPRATQEPATRSTLVINPQSHILFETHRYNGVMLANLYEEDAVNKFTPALVHTLAVMGLYGYRHNEEQREVS